MDKVAITTKYAFFNDELDKLTFFTEPAWLVPVKFLKPLAIDVEVASIPMSKWLIRTEKSITRIVSSVRNVSKSFPKDCFMRLVLLIWKSDVLLPFALAWFFTYPNYIKVEKFCCHGCWESEIKISLFKQKMFSRSHDLDCKKLLLKILRWDL